MNRSIKFPLAIVCSLLFASNALATPTIFCNSGPGIDLVADGCISGTSRSYPNGGDGVYTNAGGGDSESAVETAIFDATGSAVDIALYGKSEDNPSFFSFTPGDPSTVKSGTWSVVDQTLIYYVTVKAANSFALFQLGTPSASGVFDTAGILNNGGAQPDVSHISFWTAQQTDVPEPASMLLLGGGGILGLFSRKKKLS